MTLRVSKGAHTLFFIIQKKMFDKLKVKPNSDFVLSTLMTTWLDKENKSEDLEKAMGYMYQIEEKPKDSYEGHFQ